MKKSGEDNLENFFKKISQNHDLEFREEDWLNLEAQLDKKMPVAFSFWKMFKNFWYIILLLLLIPVSWLAITQSNSPSKNNIEIGINSSMPFQSNSGELIENDYDLNIQKSNQKSEHISSLENEKGQSNVKSKSGIQLFNKNEHNIENQKSRKLTKKQKTDGQHLALANTRLITKNIEESGYAVLENGAGKEGQILNSELHFLTAISPKSILNPGNIPNNFIINSSSEIESSKKFKPFLSFGAGYSPDFSTVGLGDMISPGVRWKIFTEFSISNRFGINTGVVMVNNKYIALGKDYHPPSKYWKNGLIAEEAYGECTMVDIPLNIRYNIISKYRHKLFISGGTSTYFVLKEDYNFTYSDEYPDDLPNQWSTDKMTVYPFGIINLSLGYQYILTKKSSLQVEPFIKIPTTGIGWGNVDLYTIGTYFIYRFKVGR